MYMCESDLLLPVAGLSLMFTPANTYREKLESIKSEGTLLEKKSRTVLDSLVRTILSQNTTDTLSARAFQSLKDSFPTYKAVLTAPVADVEVKATNTSLFLLLAPFLSLLSP